MCKAGRFSRYSQRDKFPLLMQLGESVFRKGEPVLGNARSSNSRGRLSLIQNQTLSQRSSRNRTGVLPVPKRRRRKQGVGCRYCWVLGDWVHFPGRIQRSKFRCQDCGYCLLLKCDKQPQVWPSSGPLRLCDVIEDYRIIKRLMNLTNECPDLPRPSMKL